jgi:hypothetical protein
MFKVLLFTKNLKINYCHKKTYKTNILSKFTISKDNMINF